MKNNKKPIVVISIVLILVIVCTTFVYLYFMTDLFKSEEELFAKYITQELQMLQKNTNLQAIKIYENLKKQNKYESNTSIKMTHSEGGEVSNPLNNLEVTLDIQRDNDQQYMYSDGQILYDGEKYIEAEIIKENELYGIRFTDAIKQFITLKDDQKLATIANNIGLEELQLRELINIISGNELSVQGQSVNLLKDKYFNIITKNIKQGMFQKHRKTMITYNDATLETNAYSVSLSSEQVYDMLMEVLENFKSDFEVIDIDVNEITEEWEAPIIKLTVYEQKQQTIRTVAEIGTYTISMENINQKGKTIIKYSDNNKGIEANIEVGKNNTDSEEEFGITIDVIEPNESYTITLTNQMQLLENQINLNTELKHKQNITTMSFIIENQVVIGNEFEEKQSLDSSNNMLLNNLEEQNIGVLIEKLKPIILQATNQRMNLLKQKFGVNDEENKQQENNQNQEQETQVEINRFNSKFEFYTGDEVSAENVKTLLDIVKNHLESYELINDNTQQNTTNTTTQKEKTNVKLKIKKDVLNEEATNKILEKINNNKKYKVLIFYQESNGLIDYITITEA